MRGQAYRYEQDEPWTEAETWDACVDSLLGPRVSPGDRETRRRHALRLAAAALLAAGEQRMARDVERRIPVESSTQASQM